VKRLLPCVILAIAFHAIILSIDFSWLSFAFQPISAAKSLTITLSANRSPKPEAQAKAPEKLSERQLEPSSHKKPRENFNAKPTPARIEQSTQFQNPLPVTPPKPIVKKIRHKKSLKALTFKKQHIKTIEATQAESGHKSPVLLKAETQIFTASSAEPKSVWQPISADTAFIRKTKRVSDGSLEPIDTAALTPEAQRDDTLSGTVLKLARPLYKQNTAPPYPRKARRLGYEGIVMLKVLINENGRVDDLMVFKSSGHNVLDRAALSAVRKWLFEPGAEGGIKKKMWVKIPVRFDLK
jgi:TonB family protein